MVGNMAAQGVFGDITYVEGAYLHDCRDLTCGPDGELTWRGKLQRDYNGMDNPTHSLGPVAQWIGINRTDELDFMSTYTSRTGSMYKYIRERFGDSHPGADPSYWNQGDSAVTTIRTKKGVLISLRLDWVSGRPHNMTHYALQGTRGAYAAAGDSISRDSVWIEGRSPGESPNGKGIPPAQWEPLENYRGQYEHPLWRQWLSEAERAGHGGGDFFVIDEFISAIQDKRPPAIDVYDAVAWSAVFPLSVQSVRDGGKPVSFPDFAKNKPLRT